MASAKDALRMIESLAVMLQATAERGDLDETMCANIAELMGELAHNANRLIGGEAA